jgi:hypothetical protein
LACGHSTPPSGYTGSTSFGLLIILAVVVLFAVSIVNAVRHLVEPPDHTPSDFLDFDP